MTNNCFKKESDKAMVNKGLNSLYRKLFLAYKDNNILNVLKSLKTKNMSFRKGKYVIEYDKEFENINFYIFGENGLKDIFANIPMTKKKNEEVRFMRNCNNEMKEDFLNTFNLDELKNMIEERYNKLKIK